MKKKIFIIVILISLLNIGNTYSQCAEQYYSVQRKALEPNEYDKTKVQERPYIKLNQLEAAKMLGDSINIFESEYDGEIAQYVEQITYRNGKTEIFDGYETVIVGYYPELNIIVLGNCDADYIKDMNTGEWLSCAGEPQYDRTSPSGKHRIAHINGDTGTYFYQEKVDGKYRTLGSLSFDRVQIKGLYWADDEKIHFLGKGSYDSEYWIAYTGNIKLNKE